MTWTLRPAAPDDALGIAEVHVATWRAAYAGIVPQAHLDGLSVERRAEMWSRFLAAPPVEGQSIWVADAPSDAAGGATTGDSTTGGTPPAGRRIIGFANGGPSRDPDGAGLGELRAMYVLPSHWDAGLGRALHDRVVESLRDAGFAAATLWVLADNGRARHFYERCGWRADGGRKSLDVLDVSLAEIRYRIDLTGRTGPRSAGAAAGA